MNGACPAECPFVAPRLGPEFPVGRVHRFASPSSGGSPEFDESRRNALKLFVLAGAGVAGGSLIGGSLQYVQPPTVGLASFPKVQLLDLDGSALTAAKVAKEYSVLTSDLLTFAYPLRNEPNFLLNLAPPSGKSGGATNVPFGVGPSGSIVAYSAICQHLACPAPALAYYPPLPFPKGCTDQPKGTPGGKEFYIHCSCHGSTYDVTDGASNLTGPAVLPLPQVVLEWNQSDDTLWATGMTPNSPTVNGHLSTLTGDYGTGNQSQLQKQAAVILCAFP